MPETATQVGEPSPLQPGVIPTEYSFQSALAEPIEKYVKGLSATQLTSLHRQFSPVLLRRIHGWANGAPGLQGGVTLVTSSDDYSTARKRHQVYYHPSEGSNALQSASDKVPYVEHLDRANTRTASCDGPRASVSKLLDGKTTSHLAFETSAPSLSKEAAQSFLEPYTGPDCTLKLDKAKISIIVPDMIGVVNMAKALSEAFDSADASAADGTRTLSRKNVETVEFHITEPYDVDRVPTTDAAEGLNMAGPSETFTVPFFSDETTSAPVWVIHHAQAATRHLKPPESSKDVEDSAATADTDEAVDDASKTAGEGSGEARLSPADVLALQTITSLIGPSMLLYIPDMADASNVSSDPKDYLPTREELNRFHSQIFTGSSGSFDEGVRPRIAMTDEDKAEKMLAERDWGLTAGGVEAMSSELAASAAPANAL